MVASTNLEVLEGIYAGWNAGDSMPDGIASEAEYHNPPEAIGPGVRRGQGQLAAAVAIRFAWSNGLDRAFEQLRPGAGTTDSV